MHTSNTDSVWYQIVLHFARPLSVQKNASALSRGTHEPRNKYTYVLIRGQGSGLYETSHLPRPNRYFGAKVK